MSADIEERGLPVEIGRIEKELGKLWDSTDDTKTRASLVNLAIYTEAADGAQTNTELIAELASQHACRALLILANPAAEESPAKAWISAHCHLADKGQRQICSEQITFQLDGETLAALPNVVFSHLDSDLPLYFWWRGEFREPLDSKLWIWIDRLLFDSAEWTDLPAQAAIFQRIASSVSERTALCDLNWTRLFSTRIALAQFFDHACALTRLQKIQKVTIDAARQSTGLLLLGWLAGQLGWKLQPMLSNHTFYTTDGREIEFEINTVAGPDISRCVIDCEDAKFEITREDGSDFFHATITGAEVQNASLMLSAGKSKLVDVLLSELGRGGRHPIYHRSLELIEPLL